MPRPPPSVDVSTSSMASHPFSDRTPAPRAPSSVTSHSTKHTRHRHHRTARSHFGGTSLTPQNEFPNFAQTGDVEITIACDGQERRYLLHRLILAQCSGFFEASTSQQWSGQDDGAGEGVRGTGATDHLKPGLDGNGPPSASHLQVAMRKKPFWKYELDYGSDADDVPMLVRKSNQPSLFNDAGAGSGGNGSGTAGGPGGGNGGGSSPQPPLPSARSKPPASSNGFFRSITAMQSVVNAPGTLAGGLASPTSPEMMNDLVRDYDNMFRVFYNYPPNLDAVSITEAYIQSKTLLTLADMYDALEVVGPRIDHHLLQFQGRLWKQIAKYPPSYLKLGYLARSKTIFSEALTHVVGQWPIGQAQLRNIPRPVLDLIEDKADDLDELRARLEGQLFRLTVLNSRGERANPTASNPLDWQAVCLFRYWLAENLPAPPSPIMAGMGTTANPNPTGQKSVSFNPQTTTNGRPNSSQAPMLINESTLSAGAPGGEPAVSRSNMVPATGRAFRLLGMGGQTYLAHDELKKYLKMHHLESQVYDKTQLRRFEKRIDDLKIQAQAVVKPLTRNALQMDVGARDGGGLGYLTCAGVGEGEWPW